MDDIPQNVNQSERVSSFIRLSKVDEAEDEISLGAKIIDIRKYKDERMRVGLSVFNEENEVKSCSLNPSSPRGMMINFSSRNMIKKTLIEWQELRKSSVVIISC